MKKVFLIFSMCFGFISYGQNEMKEIELWPDGAPNSNEITTPEKKVGNMLTSVTKPVLYVYPAAEPNGKAVIMCPGGGYSGLAMAHEGTDLADWFTKQGITYAVLKYRLPNGHDEIPLTDAEQAMRIMREHASEWGINPASVGIGGASAGGHLASTLATHYSSEETRPDFQILFYPVITTDPGTTHAGSIFSLCGDNPTDEQLYRYSNDLHVNSQTPKAFIIVSADDVGVPVANSLRYFEALINNGVMSTLHVYPLGGHGWGNHDYFRYKSQWQSELSEWLKNEVK